MDDRGDDREDGADATVPIDDWERVVAELRRFADGAAVTATDERARVEFARAHVEVTREGRVDAGMPLHAIDAEATTLAFDHGAGELHVRGEGVAYTFRRP